MKQPLLFFLKTLLLLAAVFFRFFVENNFQYTILERTYTAFLELTIFLLIINILLNIVGFVYKKKNKIVNYKEDNFFIGIRHIASVLSGLGVIIALFTFFGIDPVTLFTSLSIVAAAIAIITKEFISDLLAGIYISFSKGLEIGDYVKVSSHKGKILEIALLKVKVLNDDDDIIFIPNSKIYHNEIINYTKRDLRLMSIDFQMDINYIGSIEELEKKLKESLSSFSEHIQEKSYNLKIVDVKKDYLDLKFQYTLISTDQEIQKSIRKKTVRKVFSYLTKKTKNIPE